MGDSGGVAAGIVTVLGLGICFLALLYCVVLLSRAWKQVLISRMEKALKRRRNINDNFRDEFGYSWDYVITFRVYDEEDPISELQRHFNMKSILDKLTVGGLQVRLFYSLQRKEVFCKIRAPLVRLQKHADLIDYKMELDSKALKDYCTKGREDVGWGPISLPEKCDLTTLSPYEHIFARYEFNADTNRTREDIRHIYKRWPRVDTVRFLETLKASVESDPKVKDTSTTKNPLNIGDNSSSSGSNPMDLINPDSHLYESLMFRGIDRMKLIHMIITSFNVGGCYLDIYQLIKDKCILSYTPLHDMVELREIESEWISLLDWPWNQPFDKVRNYFGEKIALYFSFLGTYTAWLIPAALVGFGIWINVAVENNNANAGSVPYFAGFIGLWSALFLEHWKRTEKRNSMKWGTVGFEEEEQNRPQFKGEKVFSPITGKPTFYFSKVSRFYRSLFSQGVISILVMIVIAVIAIIFAIRIAMSSSKFTLAGIDLSGVVASILIALQIQFLNGFFGTIAIKLNNYENHRTDTEYEDALISKTFSFQFVNAFASLFYIGFIKPFIPDIDPCSGGNGNCMNELQTTLGTIFLTRLALGNFMEVGIPLITALLERRKRRDEHHRHQEQMQRLTSENLRRQQGGVNAVQRSGEGIELRSSQMGLGENGINEAELARYELSEIEKTFTMPEYHVMLGPFEDYAEMTIQFGYTTMFVAAFPLATVLSFINNYVEIRVDAWKLCHIYRRPEPRSCEDIGTWFMILEMVSFSSIFINSGLVAFTGRNTINYTWSERVWIFILMSTGLFCIRLLVAFLIPDVPEEVKIQIDRQEYLNDKIINNVPDEDDNELSKNNMVIPSYLIRGTDDDPM